MQSVDVLVVGAGPAGLCLTRSLAGSGLSVALVEQQPQTALATPAFDGREIALTTRPGRSCRHWASGSGSRRARFPRCVVPG